MADKVVQVEGVGNVAFPDSMSDDQISSILRQQHSDLLKLSPQNTAVPSAGNRFLSSTGLTTGGRGLLDQANMEMTAAVNHPIATAKETVSAPVTGYAQAAADQAHRVAQHWERARQTGDPRDYLDTAVHGLYYLLTPVGGANLGAAADQSAQGNLAGAAGSMTLPTAGVMAGSPSVRSGVRTAANVTRTATAATLDAAAKPVANIATAAGTISELARANPVTAGIIAAKGKPYIAGSMEAAAKLVRPGESPIEMLPLTRQVLASNEFKDFLNSPGISKEAPEAPPAETQPSPYSPSPYRLSGNKITDAKTATPKQIIPPSRQLGTGGPAAMAPVAQPTIPPINLQELAAQARNLDFPRTLSGESVLNQALTALDNKTLIKVARSRGIDIAKESQLKPGTADNLIIKKIIGDFSPEELDNVRDIGAEVSRNKPVQIEGVTADAGKEAWHYKVLQTYFPDVKIPQTMAARAQKTIGARDFAVSGDGSSVTPYVQAVEDRSPAGTPHSDILDIAKQLRQQDEHMADLLQKSIEQVKQKQSATPAQAGSAPQGGHAGNAVSSVEELNRPGTNYLISKSGQITYHGKSFAPEETPAGGTHVTVLPGGKIRVNAGTLNPAQNFALRKAINEK